MVDLTQYLPILIFLVIAVGLSTAFVFLWRTESEKKTLAGLVPSIYWSSSGVQESSALACAASSSAQRLLWTPSRKTKAYFDALEK